MLTHCRAIAKTNKQTFRGISVHLFDTISSKGELSMHRSLAFQLVFNHSSISLQCNGGHHLVGSELNVELTISKRMPKLLRLNFILLSGS